MNFEGLCLEAPPPGTCNPQCGEHEICDQTDSCRCAFGYAGDPCTWQGSVQDPAFIDLENEQNEPFWVRSSGATVVPGAAGSPDGDDGEGGIRGSVHCNAGGLSQTIQMPSYETAEPLVAKTIYLAPTGGNFGVGFGRAWAELPQSDDWTKEVFCLGDAAYGKSLNGGTVLLQLSSAERSADCDPLTAGEIRVDRFEIATAQAEGMLCPAPGEVLNGAAEIGTEGWTFFPELGGAAEASLAAGVGSEGPRGSAARIARPGGSSSQAEMSTRMSVPSPEPTSSPALRFWWKGTSQRSFHVDVSATGGPDRPRRSVARLVGSGAEFRYLYCLPPWTWGSALSLSFSFADEDASEEPVELLVDDVELLADERCSGSDDLLDPQFDSAPYRWFGMDASGPLNQTVSLVEDEEAALSGAGMLEIAYGTSEPNLAIESFVLVPDPTTEQGPQVRFYSRAQQTPQSVVRWGTGKDALEQEPVVFDAGWQLNELCLPSQWAGRWYRVRIEILTGSSGVPAAENRIFLDDFELATSPGCVVP